MDLLNRRRSNIQIKDPLKCVWFYPLPSQSTHRFKMMKLRGMPVGEERFINDGERLNRSDLK